MSDRKYSQRGYMEDEGGERQSRKKSQPARREGPRGRGLGRPTQEVFRCAVCGEKREAQGEVASEARCAKCGADLHSCTHCVHFDTSSRHECRLAITEPVSKKSKRNECRLFEPKVAREFDSGRSTPSDPKAAFDALFKF